MQEQARPYRSHKIPACDRCRRFKRRCTGGTSERPCVLCDLQEVPCVKSSSPSATTRTRRRVKQDRRHVLPPKIAPAHAVPAIPGDDETAHIGRDYHSSAHQDKSKKELSMLAGPVISEDIQILERYMSNTMSSTEVAPLPVTSTPANPMVYLRVPRRREGLAMAENPGKRQKEILMQILQPYADELVRLYFEESHMAFPILDEQLFLELYKSGDKLSPVLTCDFFAFALILWHHSPVLRQFPKPDAYFIWNLAVEALQQDFLAPGLSTVYSVIMDMTGRPVISMLGNTINNGRAVILAQSLGLNRDPTNWRRSKSEKSLRIRLWWAVVIHDRWSSYAHGISPTITKSRYDVPIPVLSDILTGPNQSEKRLKSAQSFIHLCTLTEILGEILPLVYDLNTDHTDWNQITRLQSDLDNWESNLPEYLRRDTQTKTQRVCGSSNLQLSYLSVRLLLNRVSLHVCPCTTHPNSFLT
ncbi:fungal-specific transcription factor domain-containing protein [Aspergillus avenaceus]|uniref:Fungal-specific transcription factor domain-containing protein n=1 Tax=Aspergillus avenaceus TaxID=36643 RepID=A0A5N6TDF4_ASPAV|nr:fungal-specific transcription factor domain-containing protein [Aspergillus avenaceus]